MDCIELVPSEASLRLHETALDLGASLVGDVRILAPPHHHDLAFDFAGPGEGVVAPSTQRSLVEVCRIKAGCCTHAPVERAAEREVPSDAHPHRAETTIAVVARRKMIERGTCVFVVGRD